MQMLSVGDGFVILINYLRDLRAIMAEHAHTELVAITGQDFGKDPAAWGEWLSRIVSARDTLVSVVLNAKGKVKAST
jgi:hypothetical protein